MAEMYLVKLPNGTLAPADEEATEQIAKWKVGQAVRCEVVKQRNYPFLKKFFALVAFAYAIFEERLPRRVYRGVEVRPNRNRFRKDLTIMAGYFEPTFNALGEMRLEAKSISFANMDEDEFEKLFSSTVDVILGKVLNDTGITRQQLEDHVARVMAFT